jgi:translation initiation factor 1
MGRLFAGTQWDRPPTCERCGKLEQECQCPPVVQAPEYVAPEKQTARLAVEKRPGKRWVTAVRGLAAADNDLPSLLAKLKAACGAGGGLKEDVIELQGQQLERVRIVLQEIGYKVKG